MPFEKYTGKYWRIPGAKFLTVKKRSVYFSREAYRFLGQPPRVDFYFDKEKKAIKITKSDTGHRTNGYNVSIQIGSVMPIGRYILNEKDKVFVYEK